MPEPSLEQLAKIESTPNQQLPESRELRRDIQNELRNILGESKFVAREPGVRSDGRITRGNILIYGNGEMEKSRTARGADFGVLTREIQDGIDGRAFRVDTFWGISPTGTMLRKTVSSDHEFDPPGTNFANESLINNDPKPGEQKALLEVLRGSRSIPEVTPQSV